MLVPLFTYTFFGLAQEVPSSVSGMGITIGNLYISLMS